MAKRADSTVGGRILAALRGRIVAGEYAPGARLPTREELVRRYRTTPVTIQRVLDVLVRDGFVEARGRLGTFVCAAPPHLSVYALVFPYRDRPERPWPHFWHALAGEAETVARANGHRLLCSYGNETHRDLDDYRRLEEDVRAQRLAGLIFASPPYYLAGSPVLERAGMPRVALMRQAGIPGVAAVRLGGRLAERLIAALLDAGRRRIAVFTYPGQEDDVCAALAAVGVPPPPHWVHGMHYAAPQAARRVAHLLMLAGPPETRPDGVLVTDDNLVQAVVAGLRDAGARVPGDVKLAAHANFPAPPPPVPMFRMGYDVRRVLAACLTALDAQRQGGRAEGAEVLPVKEADLAPPPTAAGAHAFEQHRGGGRR